MALEIRINDRAFWTNYVTTSQYEAGESLGAVADGERLAIARVQGEIDARYRPTIQRWDPAQVENALPCACAIGQAISVIGSLLAFYTYGVYGRQRSALVSTREIHEQVEGWNPQELGPVKRAIRDFVDCQLAIDERNVARIRKYAFSIFMLMAGGVSVAAGALADAALLMTVGKVIVAAAVIATLATYVWHRGDRARRYEQILVSSQNGHPGFADKILLNLPRLHRPNMEFNLALENPAHRPLYPATFVQWDWDLPAPQPARVSIV